MMKGCVNALFLYASTIYYSALEYKGVVGMIRRAQRNTNVLCAQAYKDVSFAVSSLLAEMAPLDFRIEKRSIRHAYKKE